MPTCPQCHTGYDPNVALCPRDGATLVVDPRGEGTRGGGEIADSLVGATLGGRFLISRRIGEGGMGVVYQATHTVIGREVAVKVLHERYIEHREVAARLVNEARLATAIHNEHIVDMFDFGETGDGRTFVVMELLDGVSLSSLIAHEGALPEARAIRICLQITEALGAAHARGIVHRDVKPENIFVLSRDGVDFAKVLDFGISKALRGAVEEPSLRLTHTGMVLGTPLYMSPEQARGEDGIDHRIDVYALGVILYECLTGEVPFRGTNYLGIISDVLSRVPLPPRALRPDLLLSPSLDRVVSRAMERDRERRYPSMETLAADLRRVQSGEPLEPVPAAGAAASVIAAPSRSPRARRPLYAGIACVALIAVITTAIVARRAAVPVPETTRAGAPPAHEVGPTPAVVATGAPAPHAAAPAPSPPSPAGSPAPVVTLRLSSTPSGAEVRNGDRVLGSTPTLAVLPRGDRPVHLTFIKDGFDLGATDVIPVHDGEPVAIALHPSRPAGPEARSTRRRGARAPIAEPRTSGSETLPANTWDKVRLGK